METFFIEVGFTTSRPVRPDEHTHFVAVATDRGLNDALLTAAQMVAGRGEMPTSTRLVRVEI